MNGGRKLSQLQPWVEPYAREALRRLESVGLALTVFDVYRSPEDQEKRYRLGDSKAHAGQSAHQYGLAFDVVVSQGERSEVQRWMQSVFAAWGFGVIEWDPAHVEVPGWRQFV